MRSPCLNAKAVGGRTNRAGRTGEYGRRGQAARNMPGSRPGDAGLGETGVPGPRPERHFGLFGGGGFGLPAGDQRFAEHQFRRGHTGRTSGRLPRPRRCFRSSPCQPRRLRLGSAKSSCPPASNCAGPRRLIWPAYSPGWHPCSGHDRWGTPNAHPAGRRAGGRALEFQRALWPKAPFRSDLNGFFRPDCRQVVIAVSCPAWFN